MFRLRADNSFHSLSCFFKLFIAFLYLLFLPTLGGLFPFHLLPQKIGAEGKKRGLRLDFKIEKRKLVKTEIRFCHPQRSLYIVELEPLRGQTMELEVLYFRLLFRHFLSCRLFPFHLLSGNSSPLPLFVCPREKCVQVPFMDEKCDFST